jgi:glycosyltransferase involved in cell wall biosynthesis
MDIFVLPSATETFSNAALEAMAMARPVVLSNVGGAAEMVEHKTDGYLFNVGDDATLANTLTELYDSKAERERIGNAARQRVERQFCFKTMVNRYKELIDFEE